MNVLMEKPMTTSVMEAKQLHDLLTIGNEKKNQNQTNNNTDNTAGEKSETIMFTTTNNNGGAIGKGVKSFLINHSANSSTGAFTFGRTFSAFGSKASSLILYAAPPVVKSVMLPGAPMNLFLYLIKNLMNV